MASDVDWPAHLLRCNFFGQPGSVSKFPPFLWVKLWVGWVGRGYIEISRYFPILWINRVTLVTKIKLWYSLGYQITFESQKMPLWYAFLRLEAWLVCDLNRTPNCYGKTWRFLCPFFRNLHLRENLARDRFTSTVSTVSNSVQNIFTHLRYCDK